MRTGIATFSLDYGRCPRWLFERMTRLASLIIESIVIEFGPKEFLKRISDPVWFQSFGCLLAFDWNSSGLTVVTTAAIKEAMKRRGWDLGIYVCGGKGKTSLKTPEEIISFNERFGFNNNFTELSRVVAKIDNSLIQDGFNLYHHVFIFDKFGNWSVIQQGMNPQIQKARRYHWYSEGNVDDESLLNDFHQGIASQVFLNRVLNLASKESLENRQTILKIVSEKDVFKDLKELEIILGNKKMLIKSLDLPEIEFKFHPILKEKIDFKRVKNVLLKSNLRDSLSFIDLLKTKIGPKTIRALSLIAEIIYGAPASWKDPARYTFAHGGKDGTPYPVDRFVYDRSLEILEKALQKARFLSMKEKSLLLKKLWK